MAKNWPTTGQPQSSMRTQDAILCASSSANIYHAGYPGPVAGLAFPTFPDFFNTFCPRLKNSTFRGQGQGHSDFWKDQLIPEFLHDTVFQMSLLRGLNVELLTESNIDGWTVPISILVDEEGRIDSRLFVLEPDGSSRLRRASVFIVSRSDEYVCVVAIESEPVYRKLFPMRTQDSEEVLQALRSVTIDFLEIPSNEREDMSFANFIHWIFRIDVLRR